MRDGFIPLLLQIITVRCYFSVHALVGCYVGVIARLAHFVTNLSSHFVGNLYRSVQYTLKMKHKQRIINILIIYHQVQKKND